MPARTTTQRRRPAPQRDRFAHYADRLKRVRKAVKDAGADALVITEPVDIRYLTPFSGEASVAIVFGRSLVVISDSRFAEELDELKGHAKVVMRKGPMVNTLAPLLADHDAAYAIQADKMTVDMRNALAKKVGAKSLVPTSGLMTRVRSVKDAIELKALRKAVKVQEAALESTLEQIGTGWTETEVAALLEFEMRTRGSEGPAFDVISAAGPNSSKAHYRPGTKKTATRRPLLIDWGATIDGYRSDMTRTFSFGGWHREIGRVYDIVLEAYSAGVAAIAPGVKCADVDAAAREVIASAGYGPQFGHSLGHGIGLDIHEMPSLSSLSDWVLEEGMVVTVEPGVYLPGVGGVRLENDILVTSRGARSMCSLPMDKGWATL